MKTEMTGEWKQENTKGKLNGWKETKRWTFWSRETF